MSHKVYFKRNSGNEVIKIYEEDGKFYTNISDIIIPPRVRTPMSKNITRGPFNSFKEAENFLKQELGNYYPSYFNFIKNLLSFIFTRVFGCLFFFILVPYVLIAFLIGGFQNLGVKGESTLAILTAFTFFAILIIFINWFEKRKK